MKQILLSTPRTNVPHVALVDDEDFPKVSGLTWFVNARRGSRPTAQANVYLGDGRSTTVSMHRFILGLPPRFPEVCHENGNGLDNRRGNLKVVEDRSLILAGRRTFNREKSSPYRGVVRQGAVWRAQITVGGSTRQLGRFDTPEAAAAAYDIAARERFGAGARLNFSQGAFLAAEGGPAT